MDPHLEQRNVGGTNWLTEGTDSRLTGMQSGRNSTHNVIE